MVDITQIKLIPADKMWKFIIVCSMLRIVVTLSFSSDGDVTVGGLFKVFDSEDDGSCSGITGKIDISSVMYTEAVKWYFDKLNSSGGLPFKIGKYL